MTTSGSYNWTATRTQICTSALIKVGAVSEGDVPTPEALSQASTNLNAIVKELEHIGARLWSIETTTITTIAAYSTGTVTVASGVATIAGGTWPTWAFTNGASGLTIGGVAYPITARTSGTELVVTGSDIPTPTTFVLKRDGIYTLPTDTAGVEYVRVRQNDYDYPIQLINRFQENEIYDKLITSGLPEQARFVKTLSARTLVVYPLPDDVYTVTVGVVRVLEDFDAAANTPDMFESWINALTYALAADLADDYHLPLDRCQRLEQKAGEKLRLARRQDQEQHDEIAVRGSYSTSRFRNLLPLILLCWLIPAALFGATAQQIDFLTGGVSDTSGSPLESGTVTFYQAGHIGDAGFLKDTWADGNKAATNTNPLTLGAGGRVAVFADGDYDIRVKDSGGSTIFNVLAASYGPSGSSGPGVILETDTIAANTTNATITLSTAYTLGEGKVKAYVNGVRQHSITEINTTSYSISGTLLTGWEVLSEITP